MWQPLHRYSDWSGWLTGGTSPHRSVDYSLLRVEVPTVLPGQGVTMPSWGQCATNANGALWSEWYMFCYTFCARYLMEKYVQYLFRKRVLKCTHVYSWLRTTCFMKEKIFFIVFKQQPDRRKHFFYCFEDGVWALWRKYFFFSILWDLLEKSVH